jgi:hypothetical protein
MECSRGSVLTLAAATDATDGPSEHELSLEDK